MLDSKTLESGIKGKYASVRFEDFIPTGENVFPDFRIYDFMVLGPFVLETEGAFETEYFYQREKILDLDYLASSGGEANQIPYLGKAVKNEYYGPGILKWKKGFRKWDALRFDDEGSSCDDALFATEQRNCVFYASVYVECEKRREAVLVHETSGCKAYLNGEPIDDEPYGRVKGLRSNGKTVPVRFNPGKNLLTFKIRPGYIADTIDLTVSNCSFYPAAVSSGALGITYPLPTGIFFGTKEKPLQAFQSYVWSRPGVEKAEISYGAGEYSTVETISSLKAGESRSLRLKFPARREADAYSAFIRINDGKETEEGRISVETIPVPPYDGADYVFSDFHFDSTYHQEQRTYALGAFDITRRLVDKLTEDPDFKVILSEIDYLHPYYSIYPKHRKIIKEAFERGRAEADCFYNQPNELTSSGEGFVRNLIYGQLYHRDVLGRIVRVYAPGDVFGHSGQITQICLKGGCSAIQWGKFVLGFDRVFRHVSPDGSIGLHSKTVDRNDAMALGLKHCSGGADLRSTVSSLPSDGKTGWMKETLNRSHYAVFSELLDGIAEDVEEAERKKERKVDLVSRDMTQHHSGTLLTRTDFKQADRLAENLLISAEKFSAMAAYYGAEYPEKALDKAWRQLLCAQHHDSITGTNNEISFVDLMIQYREAAELAADVVKRASGYLASRVKVGKNEIPYVIFNPHAWERKDKCEIKIPSDYARGSVLVDSKGNEYPVCAAGGPDEKGRVKARFVPALPSAGYETFSLKKNGGEIPVFGCDSSIENEFYRVCVDENLGGGIVSIFDKSAGREVVDASKDGPANRVVVLKELGERMEAQHEFYTTGLKAFSSDYKATVKSEKGAVCEKLTVRVSIGIIAGIKQEITLWKGVKRIDMNTVVEDYQSEDDLFLLSFPINARGARPVFDDRYAPRVWSSSRGKLSFQTHQYASFSHSKIAPVNQWIELGRTVRALFGSGDINIGMTAIIRNPSLYDLTDGFLIALSKKAVPVTPYSDKEQYGAGKLVHFNEDLDNTDSRFVLSVEGIDNEYETRLFNGLPPDAAKKFLEKLENNGTAVLFTRDDDNVYKKPIDVILIKSKTREALENALNRFSNDLAEGSEMDLTDAVAAVEPGVTEDYGVALINRGNICCSVEADNLMTMALFHTAGFYGNSGKTTGGKELVPEQKTHSFGYALYPHSGDYRSAAVYRKALEFNDAPFAAERSPENGILPKSKSFLKTSGNFVVTAFKAGGYPMASMKSKFGSIGDRGFTLRGFETDGLEKEIKIETGFGLKKVERTNLLDEERIEIPSGRNSFSLKINPHSIETFALSPVSAPENGGGAVLGAEKEPISPVYVRSWEHDLGSMNVGYLSTAGIIGKDVEKLSETEYKFNVSMANNRPDAFARGVMRLEITPGFKLSVSEIPYSVAPGESEVYRITVTKPSGDAAGILRMNYTDDGQTFEDSYKFGCFNPELSLEIVGDRIIAEVFNDSSERIYGELALATPFETWSAGGFNAEGRMNVAPRTRKFDVLAGEVKKYEFDVEPGNDGVIDAYWAVAKLAANGGIRFAYARRTGPRRNYWAHELARTLFGTDKGSIKRLLEI